MEILEIIPMYFAPTWLVIIAAITAIFSIIMATIISDTYSISAIIITVISTIICLVSIIIIATGKLNEYSYDKYIIKISSEVSFEEVMNKYEIIKHYEYSNVYEVKEK